METEKTLYVLEKQQAFSRSQLWRIQERYFAEKGVDAWRQGEVPHYVTSNPTIANSYAEIVFALQSDRVRMAAINGTTISNEPFYLCELGAGSGRFAFHFLDRLSKLCRQNGIPANTFLYVLTDVAESNLAFWKTHRNFQPFFENGMLDYAQFDLKQSDELVLQHSGRIVKAGSLHHPLTVIANYVFDSVPQELYYFEKTKGYECLLTIASDQQPQPGNAAELMNSLHYKYDYKELPQKPFEEKFLGELLQFYKKTVKNSHLFFPAVALRSLQRLKNLSKEGMLLLSADKGDHTISGTERAGAPVLIHHGSFSITVNYHAIKLCCEQENGIALFPDRSYSSVNTGCLLFLQQAGNYTEVRRAYQRQVLDFGPDDFYKLSRHLSQHAETMSVEDILSYLRLGHYDSQLLMLCLPRLADQLITEMNDKECRALKEALERVWTMYFPLGETVDVAWHLAGLHYEMGDIPKAIHYFEQSLAIYGPFTGTLCNLAVCCELIGEREKAQQYLLQVLALEPGNAQAKAILKEKTNNKGPIILAAIHNNKSSKNSHQENSKAAAHEKNSGKRGAALHAPVRETQHTADSPPPALIKPKLLLSKGFPLHSYSGNHAQPVQMKILDAEGDATKVQTNNRIWFDDGVKNDAAEQWNLKIAALAVDRPTLMGKIAGNVGVLGDAITDKIGNNWTAKKEDYDSEDTFDPFLLTVEGKYTQAAAAKNMKLDYHFGKNWHGYVVKVVDDGAANLNHTMKPSKEGAAGGGEYSSTHESNIATPLKDETSADSVTKLAGEGARWQCIRTGMATVKDTTKIYTNQFTDNRVSSRVRYITFPVLWKSWKETFQKQFNISDSTVVEKLKLDNVTILLKGKDDKSVPTPSPVTEADSKDMKVADDICVDEVKPANQGELDSMSQKYLYYKRDSFIKLSTSVAQAQAHFAAELKKVIPGAGNILESGYAGKNVFIALCKTPVVPADAGVYKKQDDSHKDITFPIYRESKVKDLAKNTVSGVKITGGAAAYAEEKKEMYLAMLRSIADRLGKIRELNDYDEARLPEVLEGHIAFNANALLPTLSVEFDKMRKLFIEGKLLVDDEAEAGSDTDEVSEAEAKRNAEDERWAETRGRKGKNKKTPTKGSSTRDDDDDNGSAASGAGKTRKGKGKPRH